MFFPKHPGHFSNKPKDQKAWAKGKNMENQYKHAQTCTNYDEICNNAIGDHVGHSGKPYFAKFVDRP